MPHTGSFWPSEHTEALKLHVGNGFSYSQAAAKINGDFGTSYSRNAAIGRANRIGLACPSRPKQGRQPRVYKPREKRTGIRVVRSNGNSNSMRVVETVTFDMEELRCVEVVPRNLTLMDLESGDCRYPTTDDSPFLFCGHPTMAGQSYCVPHLFLCLKPEHAGQGREAHAHTIAAYKKRFNASVLSLREKPEADWEVA